MNSGGNSGAKLTFNLRPDGCSGLVVKSAYGAQAKRLKLQAAKQRAFNSTLFMTPQVIHEIEVADFYSFTMRYVPGCNPLMHSEWEYWVVTVARWVLNNIDHSKAVCIDDVTIQAKLDALRRACAQNEHLREGWWLRPLEWVSLVLKNGFFVPGGYMHGDLTFCNQIVNVDERELYLIDFLDNIADSPLFDVVKLRQDTDCRWVRLFHDVPEKRLSRADELLELAFHKMEGFELYPALKTLNLLRLLPYAREEKVICFVKEALCQTY